jgi:hypothetical protein
MQIFISHTAADRGLAKELADLLERAGFSVWDPDSILPGDNWASAIGNALESSEVMVSLWTSASKDSSSLVRDVQFAMTRGKYRGRVVPVLVDFVTFQAGVEVPWILLKMDPIYLQDRDADLHPVVDRVLEVVRDEANASS